MSFYSDHLESGTIEVEGTVIGETVKAYRIDDGERKVWIPKSLISGKVLNLGLGQVSEFTIPEWLGVEKELV